MQITESLEIEKDRGGFEELCSDCEAYRLKKEEAVRINEVRLYPDNGPN